MSEHPSNAGPTLSSADLEIRVTTRRDGDGLALDYVLHSPNNRLEFFNKAFPGACLHRPDEWQKRIFKTLENLHGGFDSHDVELVDQDVPIELATLGEDLYLQLFPTELRRIWWRKVRPAQAVLLVSDEPWIPWEIVKPFDQAGGQNEDANGFLAICFQLTRWLTAGRTPPAQVEVPRLTVVEAGAPPDLSPLAKTVDELHFLKDLADQHQLELDELDDPNHSDVVALLGEKNLGLLHFAGHGKHDEEDAGTSGFCLHDGRMLRPRDLRPAIRGRLTKNRPLVFLNACESGRQGQSLTRLGGWPQGFLDAGCGAFIAPQWSVNDEDAHTFAITFYQALAGGKTFGEAALEARQALPVDSLGRLAYAVYSHPNGRLHLGPHARPADEDPLSASSSTRKPQPSRRPGAGVSRSRRRRPSGRRGMSRGWWGAIALIFLLLATGVGFQLEDPSETLRWFEDSPVEKQESVAEEGTEPPPVSLPNGYSRGHRLHFGPERWVTKFVQPVRNEP